MDCRRARDRLVLHVDGALPAAEAEAVRAHVAVCADCAHRLAAVVAVGRALEALPPMAAPDDLWANVRRGVRAEAVTRGRRRARVRRLVPAFAPLAAAALLVLGIFIQPKPTTTAPPPAPEKDIAAIVIEHTQLANELFVGGDDLLVAECAFPADVIIPNK